VTSSCATRQAPSGKRKQPKVRKFQKQALLSKERRGKISEQRKKTKISLESERKKSKEKNAKDEGYCSERGVDEGEVLQTSVAYLR